jgi:hypothetical protein
MVLVCSNAALALHLHSDSDASSGLLAERVVERQNRQSMLDQCDAPTSCHRGRGCNKQEALLFVIGTCGLQVLASTSQHVGLAALLIQTTTQSCERVKSQHYFVLNTCKDNKPKHTCQKPLRLLGATTTTTSQTCQCPRKGARTSVPPPASSVGGGRKPCGRSQPTHGRRCW